MKKEILFVLLKDFADWEGAYIAPNLNAGVEPGSESKYIVKTVSVRKEPVVSIGGFKVLPDYGIHDIPADYAGIVLIGGMSWFTPEAEAIVPLVKEAIEKKRLVAGICNASVFLGIHGFLNHVNHTSNGLDYLKEYGGAGYKGDLRGLIIQVKIFIWMNRLSEPETLLPPTDLQLWSSVVKYSMRWRQTLPKR